MHCLEEERPSAPNTIALAHRLHFKTILLAPLGAHCLVIGEEMSNVIYTHLDHNSIIHRAALSLNLHISNSGPAVVQMILNFQPPL